MAKSSIHLVFTLFPGSFPGRKRSWCWAPTWAATP